MASHATDMLAYAERTKKLAPLGWKTTKQSGGNGAYRIVNPSGDTFILHGTISDRNAGHQVERRLKGMGFFEAEEQLEEMKKSAAKLKTAAQRLKAEQEITAAEERARKVQHASLRNKAAGPYMVEPETVELGWFTKPHPAPWVRLVWMTPHIAGYLLEHHNTSNRRHNEKTSDHYARIILSGQWHTTHQGAAMDEDAVLQDSQHRMHAIVKAAEQSGDPDFRVPMFFFVGMPRENFKAIDEGLLRTAAQLFGKDGEKNTSALQSMIRMLIACDDESARASARLRIPNAAVINYFQSNDPDVLREAAAFGMRNYKRCYSTPQALGAARFMLRKANGADNEFVAAFFDGLISGQIGDERILPEEDPRRALRSRLENARMGRRRFSGLDQLGMILFTWNQVVQNISIRTNRYVEGSAIPRVLVCRDSGPNASAVPSALSREVVTTR